jgi:hypothetical protein
MHQYRSDISQQWTIKKRSQSLCHGDDDKINDGLISPHDDSLLVIPFLVFSHTDPCEYDIMEQKTIYKSE